MQIFSDHLLAKELSWVLYFFFAGGCGGEGVLYFYEDSFQGVHKTIQQQ